MELGPIYLKKNHTFNYIYVLYFMADILHVLFMLSFLFQNKLVDIIIISSVVKTVIVQIHTLFIEDTTDLNSETFDVKI